MSPFHIDNTIFNDTKQSNEDNHSLQYSMLMEPLQKIKILKDNDKTEISVVFNNLTKTTHILRVCKDRNLSDVCEKLKYIKNPNVACIYDYVYENGNTYIIEEYISGETVEDIIEKKGVLSEDETANIITNVCDALEVFHKQNPPIVHNDIKPSNIMVRDDGTVKLFDFDISRTYKKGQNQNTTLFGTEEYASPEHFGYGQTDPGSDIYSLGVTMHKMLTNEVLSNEHRVIYRGKLKPIVEKCLEIDPNHRYPSVKAVKRDLEYYLSRKKRTAFKIIGILCAVILLILALLSGCVAFMVSKLLLTDFVDDQTKKIPAIEEKEDIEETIKSVEIPNELFPELSDKEYGSEKEEQDGNENALNSVINEAQNVFPHVETLLKVDADLFFQIEDVIYYVTPKLQLYKYDMITGENFIYKDLTIPILISGKEFFINNKDEGIYPSRLNLFTNDTENELYLYASIKTNNPIKSSQEIGYAIINLSNDTVLAHMDSGKWYHDHMGAQYSYKEPWQIKDNTLKYIDYDQRGKIVYATIEDFNKGWGGNDVVETFESIVTVKEIDDAIIYATSDSIGFSVQKYDYNQQSCIEETSSPVIALGNEMYCGFYNDSFFVIGYTGDIISQTKLEDIKVKDKTPFSISDMYGIMSFDSEHNVVFYDIAAKSFRRLHLNDNN